MSDKIVAYKGFKSDWTCGDFKYEIGKTYEHEDAVESCGSGFHACEHPLRVFQFYSPNKSKFALVELFGELAREEAGNTKVATSKITITSELQISELVEAAVKHVFDTAKWSKKPTASTTGDHDAASATGHHGAAMSSALGGRVFGKSGCALFLCERNANGKILNVWAGIAGQDGIRENTWYTLKDGVPLEQEAF